MSTTNQLDIFNYTDPSLFLRDQWLLKKKKNESFSIRAWALTLGIKSHSQLHQMLYGKRSIPKKYVPKLIGNLNLNKKESDYFESLLNIQKAKTIDEKTFHFEKIKSISKKERMIFLEIENYEMIKNPLHYFILEILQLSKKKMSPEEIKQKMYFAYSLSDIKRALETLMRLDLLLEMSPGIYQKSKKHFYTKNDIPSSAIREHHKKMADLAKEAIELQDVHQREFNATTFNISVADIPKAKELMREFREKLISELSESSKKDKQTYQFNMNFFAITKDGVSS